jgi:hypothetical protein
MATASYDYSLYLGLPNNEGALPDSLCNRKFLRVNYYYTMEKSTLLVRKTWTEFCLGSFFCILFFSWNVYYLQTNNIPLRSVFSLILIVGPLLVPFVALIVSYPGSCMIFDHTGITCVKKKLFGPKTVVHYDWHSYKEVVFYKNIIWLLENKEEGRYDTIKCNDYFGSVIQCNGKNKLSLLSSLGAYLDKICKENNIPYKEKLSEV